MSMNLVRSYFESRNKNIQASFLKRVFIPEKTESPLNKSNHKCKSDVSCAHDRSYIFDIPHELIVEILLRLPITTIFNCSLTCKFLHCLTTSPTFFVTYYSLYCHSIHGFFLNVMLHGPPRFISTSPCVEVSTINHLEKSKHFDADLSVLGSSIGLLLLGNPNRINRKRLVIYNPATKESMSISPHSNYFSHKWGIGFIGHLYPRSFEIILVGGGGTLHTFSSRNKQWTFTIASADDNHIDNELYNSNNRMSFACKPALHAGGILCWAYGKSHLRVYNIEESHFSTIKLPFFEKISRYCLSESMDQVKFVSTTNGNLRVWVLEKGRLSWRLEYSLMLDFHLIPIGFNGMKHEIAFLRQSYIWQHDVFSYHLLERKLEKICCIEDPVSLSSWKNEHFFPYKMNIDSLSIPT